MIDFPLETRVQGADGQAYLVGTGLGFLVEEAQSGFTARRYCTDIYRFIVAPEGGYSGYFYDDDGTPDPLLASLVHWHVVCALGDDSEWLNGMIDEGGGIYTSRLHAGARAGTAPG